MRDLRVGDLLSMYTNEYGFVLYEVVMTNKKCGRCGKDDGITLQIVCNNNFGFDVIYSEYTPYNHKKGITVNDCMKNIKKDIQANKLKLFNAKEAEIKKKQLLDSEDN